MVVLPVLLAAVACGPPPRHEAGADVDASTCAPEQCDDGLDNDCDLRTDCADPDCSGVGSCAVCGAVEHPLSTPLPLPDGIGQSTPCSTDLQCTTPALPNCVHKECHASYTSTLQFVGFPAGARLDDPSKLLAVCATIEHSWLRDLEIELIPPGGEIMTLHRFVGRTGDEIYLGLANDADDAAHPVPGTGYKYCWTAAAADTMLAAPTQNLGGHQVLPAGDYASVAPWPTLAGTPLDGPWELRVTDLWPADNGFMFEWSIAFDPSLVSDCEGPIIE